MPLLLLPFTPRYIVYTLSLLATVILAVAHFLPSQASFATGIPLMVAASLAALGTRDILQSKSSILRNYPIAAHLRFLMEEIRPELRQYFFEGEKDGTPFSRDKRAIVYQRAKNAPDKRPFGTQYDVYEEGFEWLRHSIVPRPSATVPFRITVGSACTRPYSASVFNISGMSFGALSPNAIRALNKGARLGNFAHDTGEGGFSTYHRENGGDIVWQIGSGYFGCRNPDGTFSEELFAATAADEQIKMIEIKLSQGAKPGHGGVLPAAKVTEEIARARGVMVGHDCISPPSHSVFSTPIGLLEFAEKLRVLSGGKPVGIKLCIGQPSEFLSICKAMVETGLIVDFIIIDGKEGGTGAAPLEFIDHLGVPLREGLNFVHNALIGSGLRDKIKLGASGKIISAFDIARAMALGADWCNSARGFMFAIGCIQSQSCHTDRCPVGVATQDLSRQRALVVTDKADRVYNFHRSTLRSLAELVAAAGLDHPSEFRLAHFSRRTSPSEVLTFAELYPELTAGELLSGASRDKRFSQAWKEARADDFRPVLQ